MTEQVDELDLLAYADGRLSGDRALSVEAYLRRNPELARRISDFPEQDRELHRHFDRYGDEPLPDRLASLLDDRPVQGRGQRSAARVRQSLAAVILMGLTGAGGWWLGYSGNTDAAATKAFVAAAVETYRSAAPPSNEEVAGAQRLASGEPTLQRFSNRIALELRAPDLSAQGYRLVDKHRVRLDGQQGLALRYAGAKGDEVQVFLKNRWRDRPHDVHEEQRGDVTVTYWNDGPIAIAMATAQNDAAVVDALTRQVQTAFGGANGNQPSQNAIPKLNPYATPQRGPQDTATSLSGQAVQTPTIQNASQQ